VQSCRLPAEIAPQCGRALRAAAGDDDLHECATFDAYTAAPRRQASSSPRTIRPSR
jgi:hypothetical protein